MNYNTPNMSTVLTIIPHESPGLEPLGRVIPLDQNLSGYYS
jgi:hypothetical protein